MIKQLLSIFKTSSNSFDNQLANEHVLLLLRKHLFTIYIRLGLYFLVALIPIITGVIFFSYIKSSGLLKLFLFGSSIWYLGLWLIVFLSLTIYTLSTVLITDRRIVEHEQRGLFNRTTSELHSNRIQDVSTHTNGIIETFLHFGDVTIQTAGSEKQFIFHQIPDPEKIKSIIMHMSASKHTGVKTIPSTN